MSKVLSETNANTKNNIVSLTMADDLIQEMQHIDDEIRVLAFHLSQCRGPHAGTELEDWLRAEAVLLQPVAVHVEEDSEKVTVQADVPGFLESDLKVSVDNHSVKICGHATHHQQSTTEDASLTETSSRTIRTVIALPEDGNAEHASYQVNNGVLTVSVPKLHSKVHEKKKS